MRPRSFIAPDMFSASPDAWPFGDLEPQAYGLIMADPPWRFESYSDKGQAKGPEPHYQTMADADILALPVADLARADCLLWLWCTWPKLEAGMIALKGWGFEYVTGGAWDKRRWGTGYVWRSLCEPVLLARRGEPKVAGAGVPNLFSESRRKHSQKPDCAYAMAERMIPKGRRCELFSRTTRTGWDSWGDEAGKFDEAERQA